MNLKKYLFAGILFFLNIQSCESPIIFTEPQPLDLRSRDQFQARYQGKYFCDADSAWVHITSTTFYKEKPYDFEIERSELDTMSGVRIEPNRIYIEAYDQYAQISIFNDSIVKGVFNLRDTIFEINDYQVLKYYKGRQILNTKLPDGHWEVDILSMDDAGNLSFLWTVLPDDIKKLEAITPVKRIPNEEERYIISPTRMEFKEILKSKLIFEECGFYRSVRVRENL